VILLISASSVARITGVSLQHLASFISLNHMLVGLSVITGRWQIKADTGRVLGGLYIYLL
jgi:hypothetical protein